MFDYAEPFENYPADRRENVMAVAARAASLGEPWLSLFDPVELSEMLRNKGFGVVEDLGLAELTNRLYGALKQASASDRAATFFGHKRPVRRSFADFAGIAPNLQAWCELVHKHHILAELQLQNRLPY